MKFGCVVLAAGAGKRFGGGKLLSEFRGIPLYLRALEAVPTDAADETAVVSGEKVILEAARARGFFAVENICPEEGISRSIRLGLEALSGCEGLLFMVADQPLLTRDTARSVLLAGAAVPGSMAAPEGPGGELGNPCYFHKTFYTELAALQGDKGGRRVMLAHPEALITLPAPAGELSDVDSRQALRELEAGEA